MPIATAPRRSSALVVLVSVLGACAGGGSGGGGSGGDSSSALTVTPGSVGFSTVQNATIAPTSKAFSITVIDPNAYYVLAGYPAGATVPTWLTKSLYGSGKSWTLGVAPSTTALAAGSYSATLRVGVARQDQSVIGYRDVQVTYAVQTGIAIWPTIEGFDYVLGSSTMPSTQTVVVSGTAGLAWTATSDQPWVLLSTVSGTVPSTPVMSVSPAGLGVGAHGAVVTFTGGGVTSTVATTLNVTAPALTATPASVSLGGESGHDLGGRDVQLVLSTGANAFAWSAAGAPTWLKISPPSGTVSGAAQTITLSPDATGLAAGTYTGSVTLTADVNGTPVATSVPVTLTLDAHALRASDNGVALASTPGLARLTRTLRIRSNRGLATTWNASTDAPSWLAVTATGTTADGLVLTADPTGLAADTLHRATVSITSGDPTIAGTETVDVALWIGSTTPSATTPVTPPAPLAEIAADPLRPRAYVHARGTDVTVYDVYAGSVVGTIASVGKKLGAMAVSSDGARLFVVDDTDKTIVPVDLETYAVGNPWPLVVPTYTSEPSSFVAYARVQGMGVVVASDGHAYDAATGSRSAATFGFGPVLAASRDGSRFCGILRGFSPYTLRCYPLDVSAVTGQVLIGASKSPSAFDLGSNGRDVAMNEDGSRVYVAAGSPYAFDVFDATASGTTMPKVATLAGDAYPNAVEVGFDGRAFCGASSTGMKDVWVYDAAGTWLSDYKVTSLGDRGVAVSGDGLRMITIAGTTLKFITVGP